MHLAPKGTAPASPRQTPAAAGQQLGVLLRATELAYESDTNTLASWALRDFELELPAGQWTCLLGASGIGKSTVLRHLAGLLPTGEADIITSDNRPLAGRVAYMDQRDLLLPWLSVRDNVQLGARLRGEAVPHEATMALLEAVGLAKQADTLPNKLSGGMRQRAALARTLTEQAPVVLMDEPFSALDALNRYRLQALAARLLRGRTVLLVTHDPNEALRLGHRVHVLSGEPARLGPAMTPGSKTPREPMDEVVQHLLPDLLRALGMSVSDLRPR